MRNSAIKTFHFRPSLPEVLRHLTYCSVCLSRLTGALEGTVGLDAIRLVQGIQLCLASSLGRLDRTR